MLLLGLAAAVACSARGNPTPEDAQPEAPEKLSSLCGKEVGTSSRGRIGWLEADATDVTDQFRELLERVRAGEEVVPEEASQYVWLLAPGLFSSKYPSYMRGNVKALRELGLRYQEVGLTPEQTLESAAKQLRQSILDATAGGKRTVILAHSKGGLEASAALALYPELRPRVRAVVTLQSPYGGSPIATDIEACPELVELLQRILGWLGDDPGAVADLTYAERRAFVAKHPHPDEVATLSLASSRSDWRSTFMLTARYIRERYEQASDGMVVPADAVIPGARWVELDDMDHTESVLGGLPGLDNYDPGEVTQVLVALALEE